jgi:hypothetical protein
MVLCCIPTYHRCVSEEPSLFYVLSALLVVVGILGLFALSWVKSTRPIEQERDPAQDAVEAQPHRFPPPWSVRELEACFVVSDANGQKVAYVYFEEDPGRRSAAKLPTKAEAQRIAVNFARLPELLRSQPQWR